MKDFNEFDPSKITGQYAPPPPQPESVTNLLKEPKIGKRSRVAAILLLLFLGGLGIHNFYLGYTAKGVIQLILTLTVLGAFITVIWELVELIQLAFNGHKFVDADGMLLG